MLKICLTFPPKRLVIVHPHWMLVKDSTILGDVIAKGDSSLTLENTLVLSQGDEGEKVSGNIFVTDDATITLISSTVEGKVTIQGMGRVVWP